MVVHGTHAFVTRQAVIDDCVRQAKNTFGNHHWKPLNGAEIDHFGFVRPLNTYITDRDDFWQLLTSSRQYAIEAGFVLTGPQARDSELHWRGRRLNVLALVGQAAMGVTTGYIGVTVKNKLEEAAYSLYEAGINHRWEKLFDHRCVAVNLGDTYFPMYRLYIFEEGIQDAVSKLQVYNR